MRDTLVRLLPIALLALALATSTVQAQDPPAEETPSGPVSLVVLAHSEGSGGYFTIEGQDERNPRLSFPPDTEVTITLRAADGNGAHNFCVENNQQCTDLVAEEGGEATLTFTTPASGTVEYYCQPHRAAGMRGTLAAEAGGEPGGGEGGEEAPAEPTGPISLVILSYSEGSGGYFTVEGEDARNPRLNFPPNTEVTITLRAADGNGAHNFCFGANSVCTDLVSTEGQEATVTFTTPESGSVEYYCQPHRGAGMKGTAAIGATGGEGGGAPPGEEGQITGNTIDLDGFSPAELVSLGVAADEAEASTLLQNCAGRKAPAIVTQGIVGAPTLADYFDACRAQQETEDKHVVDYVIPLSWLLIGLGVVGVVWVHKYYKP